MGRLSFRVNSAGGVPVSRHNRLKLLLPGVAALLCGAAARAANTVYSYSTASSGASDLWSTGADWNVKPVSGTATELNYFNGTTFASGFTNVNTDDNAGQFSLDALDLQGTGPGSGAAAMVNINNTSPATGLTFVNGTVVNLNAVSGGAGLTYNVSAPITLAGTVTFQGSGTAAFDFTGPISGNFTVIKNGASALTLTGPTGTLASTTIALNAGELRLDNRGSGNSASNRLAAGAIITMDGGTLHLIGPDQGGGTVSESIAGVTLDSGPQSGLDVEVLNSSTDAASLTIGTLNRASGGGVALVNGLNLGQDSSSAGVGRIFVTTAPPLVGGTAATSSGLNAAAQNTKIIPFLLGEVGSGSGSTGTGTGVANTFITYNSATGLRPLNLSDEFTNNSVAAGNNIWITAATPAASSTSINSLIIAGGDLSIADGAVVTDTSGALLFTSNNAISPSGTTGAFGFGAAEGMISVDSGKSGTISTVITGLGGITKSGAGTLTLSAGSNYAGQTTLNAGTLSLTGGNDRLPTGTTLVFGGSSTLNLGTTGQLSDVAAVSIPAEPTATTATLAGNGSLSTPLISFPGTTAVNSTLTGGTIVIGAGGMTIDASAVGTTSGVSKTVASKLTGSGNLTLNAFGNTSDTGGGNSSLFNLTGVNTFTGTVIVTTGLVTATADTNFGSASNLIELRGGGLVVTGNVTLPATRSILLSGAGDRFFRAYSGTTLTLAGVLSGTGNLRKTDGGTLTLTGANTYSGISTIGQGTLNINSDSALGVDPAVPKSDVVFTGSSTLRATAPLTLNANRMVLINSGVTGTFDTNGNGETIAGAITGAGALTKIGSGTLTLSNINTYSGATTISAGSILLDNAFAESASTVTVSVANGLQFGTARSGYYVGALGGSGTFALTDGNSNPITLQARGNSAVYSGAMTGSGNFGTVGGGAQTLTGANTYTGNTIVQGGTLKLDFTGAGAPASNIVSSSSQLSGGAGAVQGGGTFLVGGANAGNSLQTVNGLLLNAGRIQITATPGTGSAAVLLNLGTITHNPGGDVNFTLPAASPTAANAITTFNSNTNGILGGWATVGTDWASNANDANGSIVAYAGYTSATASISSDPTTNVTIASGASTTIAVTPAPASTVADINTLRITDTLSHTINIGAGNTLRLGSSGAIWRTDTTTSSADTIGVSGSAGTLTAGGAPGTPGEIVLYANASGTAGNTTALNINSVITDNGTGNALDLVKDGNNCAILAVGNTYTGGTFIVQGRLNANVTTSLGTGTVTIEPGAQLFLAATGTIANNFVIAGTGTSENAGFGAIRVSTNTLGTPTGTITLAGDALLGSSGGSAAIASKITGPYNIAFSTGTSNNPTTYTLSNTANDFGGNLGIDGFTSAISNKATTVKLGAAGVVPHGAGKGNVLVFGGSTAGNNSTFDLNGFSTTINGLASGGTSAQAIVTNNSSANSAATLTLGDGNANGNFAGILQDGSASKTLAIAKIGSGTQVLSGASTYSGGTTVSAGYLLANTAGPGSATGTQTVNVNGGVLAGSGNIGGPISVNSGTISAGDGVVTTGNLTTAAAESWTGGAAYNWKINLASPGTAGGALNTDTARGASWDQLSSNTLAINTTGVPFTITLTPLNIGSAAFNPNAPYQWAIANATSLTVNGATITGNTIFDPAIVQVDASRLAAGGIGGNFSAGSSGGDPGFEDVVISYSPAPEPTSLLLLGAGSAGLLLRRRRRP